jgi:hypothetical protein
LKFNDASNRIDPWNVSTNASVDGAFDLGKDDRRFKDLYLSGTGYVGTSLGIGNSSPAKELHIGAANNTNHDAVMVLNNGGATGYRAGIEWRYESNTTPRARISVNASNQILEFDTAGAEAMRIDSSGRLLLGNTDGSYASANADNIVMGDRTSSAESGITFGSTLASSLRFADAGAVGQGIIQYVHDDTVNTDYMNFYTAATERMRIDSSGNLLVGMTTASTNNDGAGIRADGLIHGKRAEVVATFNRKTSNGTIVELAKDNTVVGSIGTNGNLYIQGPTGTSGAEFANNAVRPWKDGARVDATVDLGVSAGRFKDLYLSGGVYLGGTGAANKLDDYEEGTFTPTIEFGGSSTGVTYSAREGVYTKVGRLVTCFIRLQLSSNGSLSGSAQIESLPFTVGNVLTTTAYQGGSHMVNVSNAAGAQEGFTAVPNEATTGLIIGRIADSSGNSAFTASTSQITNTFDFRLTVTYMVA